MINRDLKFKKEKYSKMLGDFYVTGDGKVKHERFTFDMHVWRNFDFVSIMNGIKNDETILHGISKRLLIKIDLSFIMNDLGSPSRIQ